MTMIIFPNVASFTTVVASVVDIVTEVVDVKVVMHHRIIKDSREVNSQLVRASRNLKYYYRINEN